MTPCTLTISETTAESIKLLLAKHPAKNGWDDWQEYASTLLEIAVEERMRIHQLAARGQVAQ